MSANQAIFSDANLSWRVELSPHWDVLGPFPIHAREQQYLSPGFPLNLSEPVDFSKSWPSSYADGGSVRWTTAQSTETGQLQVTFPDIRWQSLRSTEGWAALQHHAVLHSSITVYPPQQPVDPELPAPHLLVNLLQGSYFTILHETGQIPQWHAGNIYAMERAPPRSISLPVEPSPTSPTTYDIFISGDYEIRLFGDPTVQGSDVPVQSIMISVEIEQSTTTFVHEPTQDVICDFVEGFAFGDTIGFGIRSLADWWTVHSVVAAGDMAEALEISLHRPIRIAPLQTRTVPVRLIQTAPVFDENLQMNVTVSSMSGHKQLVTITLPLKHHRVWSGESFDAIIATYMFAASMPSYFSVVPPKYENKGSPQPVILALHGAGVDIVEQSFWSDAMPRNDHSWFVLPSGRTSWGLDWHGPSCADAWSSVDALVSILESNPIWHPWKLEHGAPVVLIGHSNGGQGVWYQASRYPDRVLAAVPASAYIKSQQYVPLTLSRSAHYIDPILRAILESSLTPDDNDLFLTNLVDTPILAIHGGNDENVPVWHSRELVSALKTWYPMANILFREDAGQSHWYTSVFQNDEVRTFLDNVLSRPPAAKPRSHDFMLTVAIPSESGSLHGWQIEVLNVPGRLARIRVQISDDGTLNVVTSNVRWFSVNTSVFPLTSLRIDNVHLNVPSASGTIVRFEAVESKMWRIGSKHFPGIESHGRMQGILSSSGPILLVVPDEMHSREMSIALRLAHDLNVYHKLDANIITSAEVAAESLNQGNIIAVGNEASTRLSDHAAQYLHAHVLSPVFDTPGVGILAMHAHPTLPGGRMVFIQSTDPSGLERSARLFPIRTGVAIPDWLVIGPLADQIGAGGILAAGLWGNDYTWNDAMSWTF